MTPPTNRDTSGSAKSPQMNSKSSMVVGRRMRRAVSQMIEGSCIAGGLKVDASQNFRGLLVERLRDRKQTLDAGQVGAAFDGAHLRYAELALVRQVLQGPVALDAQHLDAMTEEFAQAVLGRAAQTEGFDGMPQNLTELRQREGFRKIVEDLHLEGSAHVLERRVAGDDDHAQARPSGDELFENLVAGDLAHFHIEQDDLRRALLAAFKQGGRMAESAHGVCAFVFQEVFEVVAEVQIVVEDGDIGDAFLERVHHI